MNNEEVKIEQQENSSEHIENNKLKDFEMYMFKHKREHNIKTTITLIIIVICTIIIGYIAERLILKNNIEYDKRLEELNERILDIEEYIYDDECYCDCDEEYNRDDDPDFDDAACTEDFPVIDVPEAPKMDIIEFGPDLKKPVIYLYGYNNEKVTVDIDLNGDFGFVYPEFNRDTGWEVTANKDGSISYNGDNYEYLFWEGTSDIQFDFSKGFCIKGEDTVKFLNNTLTSMGLNYNEREDFITYWGPQMVNNKYNIIAFQTSAYTNAAKLNVNPKPDHKLRVFMAWYSSDTEVQIPAQKFKTGSRKGKLLVEWGGCEVNKDTLTMSSVAKANEIDSTNIMDLQVQQALLEQQALLIAQAAAAQQGHTVTDKNGTTDTFTNEEWEKLKAVWNGNEELIMHHTISELRTVLQYN